MYSYLEFCKLACQMLTEKELEILTVKIRSFAQNSPPSCNIVRTSKGFEMVFNLDEWFSKLMIYMNLDKSIALVLSRYGLLNLCHRQE